MKKLHDHFGVEVVFVVPVAPVYASGTVTDPQTGTSFDPWEPSTQPEENLVTIKAQPINPTITARDDAQSSPVGTLGSEDLALIVTPEDYPLVEHAIRAQLWEQSYKVTDRRPDGIAGTVDRYIIYLKKN